ncbi:MAG: IS21 family transposase [Alkalimonas sp.]|nr:IS21 family transposase [Alkalimonas sp.]
MSTIKQILRHKLQGKPTKWIARTIGVSKNTVRKYHKAFEQQSQSLQQLLDMDESQLHRLIHPEAQPHKDQRRNDLVGRYEQIKKDLTSPGVTRFLLWEEYRRKNPEGYSYSQFCWHLQHLDKQSRVSGVIDHAPGDHLYVDFAGKTMPYVDPDSGELRQAQVFVATLGYSHYSYVEAVASQKCEDFIGALVRCLNFFGGAAKALVPDNLKSAVIQSNRYEPKINRVLEDFANHYDMAVIPARARSPQDKALVETMVKLAYQNIYAPLRNQEFVGLAGLNQGISEKLKAFHQKCFQGRDYSRGELFTSEQTALSRLPDQPFEILMRRKATVQKNAHVLLGQDKHYYSVPYRWLGSRVELIYTDRMVLIYCNHEKIAHHVRNRSPHRYTTVKEHLPSHLQHYMDRSPEYYQKRCEHIGQQARQLVTRILESRKHPEQAYKSCDGLLALARKANKAEFLRACQMALTMEVYSYGFVKRVLQNGMASTHHEPAEPLKRLPDHHNTRGKDYYARKHSPQTD